MAMEMVLTGELVTASRAAEFGLVNRLVKPETALAEAIAVAEVVARNGPLAVAASKAVLRASQDWPVAEGFERQRPWTDPVRASEDAREGARAFTEKRAPVWRRR
jgi:enoyl-CoA hydratase